MRHGRQARVAGARIVTLMCAIAGCLAGAAGTAPAQTAAGEGTTAGAPATPGTRQMIEALKPATQRGRNLIVRPSAGPPAASAAVAAPSPAATESASPTPPGLPTAAHSAPVGPSAPATQTTAAPMAAPAAFAEPASSLSLPIQFEANSSRVRPESGALLGNLVAAMMSPELQDSRFVIEGHTDARGNAAANRRLSQERAEEVRQYLILLGVHASRLQAVGKGSSEPADARDPRAAENRRVRVVTLP